MVKKYFKELNYTLGNEDTSFDAALTQRLGPESLFSIAGCGSRAFPLLNEKSKRLVLADFSKPQLHLSALRLATYKHLDFENFLIFWGFPPFGTYDYRVQRKELFYSLELSIEVREFFENVFLEVNWVSLLYLGKWEKTFKILASLMQKILGCNFDRIFEFTKLEDQIQYYRNEFPLYRWKAVIFLLGNKSVFNTLLYKGDFIKKNVPESHFEYYFKAFEKLFTNQLVRESFFAHLCFFGEISHPDGKTIEARENNFSLVKKSIDHISIDFWQGDMISLLSGAGEKFDFVALSDVPSYFTGDTEKNFLQKIRDNILPDGHVVLRYYLRVAEADECGYTDVTDNFLDLIAKEAVQMYRIKILRRN